MLAQHELLVKQGAAAAQAKLGLEQKEAHIAKMEGQNALLRPEVERFEERQRQAAQLDIIKQKIPWTRYENARLRYMALKDQREVRQRELQALEKASGPAADALQKAKDQQAEAKDAVTVASKDVAVINKEINKCEGALEKLEEKSSGQIHELKQAKKDIARNRHGIEKQHEELAELSQELAALPDDSVYKPEMEQLRLRKNTVSTEISDLVAAAAAIAPQLRKCDGQLKRHQDEIRSLIDVVAQRMRLLKQDDPQTHTAVLWLRDNQARFSAPIAEPLMLTMNATEPRYATFVESVVNKRDWTAFVAQSKEDMKDFLDEVRNKQRLKVV